MSIFSVLKYPISSPPKAEELAALPRELFIEWIHSSDWKTVKVAHEDHQHIADWYKDHWEWMTVEKPDRYTRDIKDLEVLRQMVHDWDEQE